MDIEVQYDKIYRYCYFKLFDKQLAQDITQETFLRFYRHEVDIKKNQELPYLYTIAKNLCIDAFRKKTVESLDDISEEMAYDPTDKWINDFTLKTIIGKLPQDEQDILYLRYASELSIVSISKIIGLSRFVIHRKIQKTLKWLEEELKKEGYLNEHQNEKEYPEGAAGSDAG